MKTCKILVAVLLFVVVHFVSTLPVEDEVVAIRTKRHYKHKDEKKHSEECKHEKCSEKMSKHERKKWEKYYKKLKEEHEGSDPEFWKMEKDDKKKHYPPHLKKKIEKGEKIKQAEEDKFENEFGRYYQRNTTSIIDVISSINTGNDITEVEEGDLVVTVPHFDYRDKALQQTASELECDDDHGKKTKGKKKPKEKKHNCHKKKSKGKKYHHHKYKRMWEERKRDARRDRVYLWLNRVVPYTIDSTLSESADTIKYALQQIEEKTCIRFKEYKDEPNWVVFVKKSGCWSSVGRKFWSTGPQEISLGSNCMYTGIIIHEVLHTLGFWHEQSRPDRGKYVEIFWENIQPNEQHNFNKYGKNVADVLTAPYDFDSIMHYGKNSFAINAKMPTIQSLIDPATPLGQRDGLSATDIFQINLLYDCANTGTGWSNWSQFGPCDTSCSKERTRFCMDPKDRMACSNPLSTELLYWGVDVEKAVCPDAECYAPIDGHWNKWGAWGDCSVTCDDGIKTRSRECTDPAPVHGGKACDGSNVQTHVCKRQSCDAGPYDCGFDIDSTPLCTWSMDSTSNFNWKRNSGFTPSSGTGPDCDNTTGTGHYMYIESSSPCQAGWKARLVSESMKAGSRCLRFAYNMYGLSTGNLNVYVKDVSTHALTSVFTKSGDQLKLWHDAEIDVASANDYQIVIEGVRGNSFQGDSAIDDITVKDGACNEPVTTPPPPEPTVKKVGCYYSKGYIDGKRTFPVVKNLRDHIVWTEWERTLKELILLCSAFARENNYEYFSIEYYGECWTGPTSEVNYGRDGETSDCWPGTADNVGPALVGQEFSGMVYKWV